ncbi:MAG: cytochrome c oxidase subunit II [Planctomycetes bacterium]|nr:cytochrome c oxidase subunit II [Planctomycetota bacterium]
MSWKSRQCAISVSRGERPWWAGWLCVGLVVVALAGRRVDGAETGDNGELTPPARQGSARQDSTQINSVFDTVSPPADSIRDLFYLVTAITGVILLLVGGMLIYCIIRFRQRKSDRGEPPQLYGSQPIELAWTVAPLLTVFVLLMVVIRTVADTRRPEIKKDAEPVRVRVIGHRWWWEYQYPDYPGLTTANELHVPGSAKDRPRPVHLELESADVVHSYWVPRLAGKTDLIPGHKNMMWFQTEQEGVYRGQCAEYCGTQHANMLIRVVVDSPDTFKTWAAHQAAPQQVDPQFAAGLKVFMERTCVNCHAIRGTEAKGTVGPDLTHLATRKTLAAGAIDNTPEKLAGWLRDPQTDKPGCDMPSLRLTEKEIQDLVGFLGSLD